MDATFVREKTEVEMLKLGLLGGISEKIKMKLTTNAVCKTL